MNSKVVKFSTFLYAFIVLNISLFINILLIYYICNDFFEPKKVIVEKTIVPENIVFLGDSITNRYDIDKYFPEYNIVNSGIDGNETKDILDNMEERVYKYNPSKVILLIGINDLLHNNDCNPEEVYKGIVKIVKEINTNRPYAKIYIQTVLPINENMDNFSEICPEIIKINDKIKEYCAENKITIINTYDRLVDEDNSIKEEYTNDGLHISDEGYEIITEEIKKAIK